MDMIIHEYPFGTSIIVYWVHVHIITFPKYFNMPNNGLAAWEQVWFLESGGRHGPLRRRARKESRFSGLIRYNHPMR